MSSCSISPNTLLVLDKNADHLVIDTLIPHQGQLGKFMLANWTSSKVRQSYPYIRLSIPFQSKYLRIFSLTSDLSFVDDIIDKTCTFIAQGLLMT